MTESKRKAIMNASTFDELLDAEYGVKGTPEREKFEAHAKAYAKAETDDNISLTQYEEAKKTIERLMPIVTDDMPKDNPNVIKLIEASDIVEQYEKENYPIG